MPRAALAGLIAMALAGAFTGGLAGAADPDFSSVSDILGGQRYLLRQDDLVLTSTQLGGSPAATAIAPLYSTSSTLSFNGMTVPWGGPGGGVNGAQGNFRTAVGRMFNLPNDVVATVGEIPSAGVGVNVYDPKTGLVTFTTTGQDASLGETSGALMADFTGDGYADLVTLLTTVNAGSAAIAVATATEVGAFGAGLTVGAWTPVTPNPQPNAGGTPMAVGDFDGDGKREIALVTCPQTACSVQVFAVDPNTVAVSMTSAITLPGLTSGTASLAAGRFGATDHDQLVVAYQPASGNAIVATIDFDASLQPSLKAVAPGITGSPGFFWVKTARLDWFAPYDYAVLVGGGNIQILNFSTDGTLTPGIHGPPSAIVGCVNDVAVGNFNNTTTNPRPPPATTIDPNLQIAVLTANECDGGASGGIAVTIYFVDDQFTLFVASMFDVPSNALAPSRDCNPPGGPCGWFQNLAAGDLQGRSLPLGPPETVRVTGSIQPHVILGLPPMHIDFIQDAHGVPGGTPTVLNLTALPSAYFSQYQTEVSHSNQSSNRSTTSYTFSTKESAEGTFSYGVPDVASVSVDLKASAQQTHDHSVATAYNTYASQQFDVSTQTGFSDVVWFTQKRFTIYAYPVLGRCSPAVEGCPAGTTRPLYVQFSGPDTVTQGRIDGNQLEWYQPVQEPGNVFSYPGSAGLLRDLYGGFAPLTADPATVWATDSSGSTVSVSWSQGSGSSVTTGSVSTQSFDGSTTVSASAEAFGFGAELSGSFDYNSSRSVATLNESTSTVGSSSGIAIRKPGFIDPASYAYTAQTYIFGQAPPAGTAQQIPLSTAVQSGGPLWTAFVADPTDPSAGFWWKQAYTRPDVALNHPSRWIWTPPAPPNGDILTFNRANPGNPADSEFYFMKGLYITPAGAGGQGSQIVQATAGEVISLQARVYNYSLAGTPPGSTVHVRFYGQPWDENTGTFTGAAFPIEEVVLTRPIPGFGGQEPNWVLAGTTFDTTQHANQYVIFWVVVWMEQNGELVPELTGHGLTAIPGPSAAPTAVAIERYSNNVGFYRQPFFVCPKEACPPARALAPAPAVAAEKVRIAPGRVSTFESATVTTTLVARESSVDGVLVVYHDGDPQRGGEAFDAELIPRIRAHHAYVNRVKFRPRTCGLHTVFVVAQGTTVGSATLEVDCRPPAQGQIRSGTATSVGTGAAASGNARGGLKLSGVFAYEGPINLAAAAATVSILAGLHERGSGELVLNGSLALPAGGRNTARTARFRTAPGVTPAAEVTIGSRGRGQFTFLLDMSRTAIDVPGTCPRPELATAITVDDGTNPPLRIAIEQPWQCLTRGTKVEYLRTP